jgi:hypothetical protein
MWYEIEDFGAYVDELSQRGVESPKAQYRIFVSSETTRDAAATAEFESEIALFFRLGPTTGIDYEITGAKATAAM